MLENSVIKIASKRTKRMNSCSNRNRIENSSDLLLLKKTYENQKLLQFSAINSNQNYNHTTSTSTSTANKIQSTETIKNNNIENCIFDIQQKKQKNHKTESDDYHCSQQDTLTISTSTTTTNTVRKFPLQMSLTDDSDNEGGGGDGVNNNGVNVCADGHHNKKIYSTTDISMLSSLCIFSSLPTKSLPPTLCASISFVITSISSRFLKRQRQCRIVLPAFDFLLVATIFSFLLLMIGDVQNGVAALQHRDLNQNQLKKPEPMFISRSETFKFVAGSTMLLPCEVADTAEFVVAWKRGIAILSAGSVKVTPDPRVRLVNGFNLQIRDAVPQDAGDYICQIAMLEPREITHTVEILVPPRIHHISSGGHLQVKKGASVRIECSASGNPTPNVTWSRKNNILPNGDEMLHSTILSVENMDRHKGGVYICKANNGVGQPASSQVVLHVLYPPEISVERPVVYSGEGHEAMLVCIVHGEAQPEVIWFKETMQLDTTERHIMENRGSRHTLIIRKVHPQDFGNYSCVAENQLGKSRKTLQLSGKPNTAVFSSPPISQYKDRYNISWTVDSHTPVEEFKLYFRRLPQGHEVDNTIEQPMHLSSSSSLSMHMYGINSGGGGGGVSSNIGSNNNNINSHNNHRGGYNVHWPRSDWRDVVLPAVPLSHHYTQGMSYMIRGLEPDQHYEAKVNARNRYGWSDLTESFLFSTSSNDAYLDPSSFRNLGLSDNEMRDLSVTFYGSSAHSLSAQTTINKTLIIKILCILVKFLTFLNLV